MLTIVTDINDTSWLSYILEEWHRIQNCDFSFNLVREEDKGLYEGLNNVLYYTSKPPSLNTIWIPQRANSKGSIIQQKSFYILQETIISTIDKADKFDVFWNAFYFLSRKEEYDYDLQGKAINSYSGAHPRINKSTFEQPIVNILFEYLEEFVTNHFPSLKFSFGKKANIELSHDLDYIKKTTPLLLKQTAMNAYKTVRSVGNPKVCINNLKRTLFFFFSRPSYWCFDYWTKVESDFDQKSIFYVYAQSKNRNVKQWLLDPSYSIKNNNKLQDKLKKLLDLGHEVGLHGSFYSSYNKTLLEEEKHTLSKTLDVPITKGRQHWLRYSEQVTPHLHESLFEVDSTVGFNDRIGFRAGICSQYRPYSHSEKRAFNYFITPQFVMDSNIFEYSLNTLPSDITKKTLSILENCINNFKNIHLAISWHPRTASSDYNWHLEYEKIINLKKSI